MTDQFPKVLNAYAVSKEKKREFKNSVTRLIPALALQLKKLLSFQILYQSPDLQNGILLVKLLA